MARTKAFCPEQVLEKAMEVFWANGYEATSIEDLVAATGVNRASLYGTYGGKEALFLSVLDRYMGSALIADARQHTGTPGDKLRYLFDQLIRRALEKKGFGCLVTNTICEFGERNDKVLSAARSAVARIENGLDQLVREGQASGEIAADIDARQAARQILATMNGMQVLCKINPNEHALRQIADGTLSALLVRRARNGATVPGDGSERPLTPA